MAAGEDSRTLFAASTPKCADVVEWCPKEGSTSLCLVGMYELDKASGTKSGKLQLFDIASDGSGELAWEGGGAAVLDAKWSQDGSGVVVGCFGGLLQRWVLESGEGDGVVGLARAWEVACGDAEEVVLSVDEQVGGGKVAASLRSGGVAVMGPRDGGGVVEERRWAGMHEYSAGLAAEVWCVCWSRREASEQVLWSGGDDGRMCGWDVRVEEPTFVNARSHEAGVCSVRWHPSEAHLVASGAYDDCVRLWDARKPSTPLSKIDVGGGAWRVRWHPSPRPTAPHLLLVAAMRGGCRVLQLGESLQWEEVDAMTEHPSEALAYGIDWCRDPASLHSPNPLVASCSFYDQSFRTWALNPKPPKTQEKGEDEEEGSGKGVGK